MQQDTAPTNSAPFIGHAGAGSRLTIRDAGDRTVIKEHLGFQLVKSLALLVFGPGGTVFIYLKWNELGLLFPFLAFFSAVGWWFGLKFLMRLLGGRRVEIQRADRSIRLFSFLKKVEQELRSSEIGSVGIETTHYRSEERNEPVPNYTLVIRRRDGRRVELCTSDRREPLETIAGLIGARRHDIVVPATEKPVAPPSAAPGESALPQGVATAGKGVRGKGCLILLLLYAAVTVLYKVLPRRGNDEQTTGEEPGTTSGPRPETRAPVPKPDLMPGAPQQPVLREDGSYILGIPTVPTRWDEATLCRGLDGEEGERFRIPRNGLLTLVEAQIWTESNRGEIVASVYCREDGGSTLLGSSRIPAGRFPRYTIPDSPDKVPPFTSFPFSPPLPLRAGEVIDVMFSPTVESAVSGILQKDEYPGAVIAFYNGRPGIPEPVDWDYLARITIAKDDGSVAASASRTATSRDGGPTTIGAPWTVDLGNVLMRDLGSGGEGQRFRISRAGRLTRVEAAIWAESARGEVVATVYRRQGIKSREERQIVVPAAEFPSYGGIRSLNRLTLFRVDPPLAVEAGQTIDVIFRTKGMEAVSGIQMTDAYPDTEMVFYNNRPGIPKPVNWDFIARATVE